jgi:hypothetical protein
LRARPEQTQFEDLSDAPFLGKLLVLPANVRPVWKVFARCKHSSLFGLAVSNEEKSFLNCHQVAKCFFHKFLDGNDHEVGSECTVVIV